MNPPNISLGLWWVIAAAGTLVFLAVCPRLMPTKRSRAKILLVPVVMMAFGLASMTVRGMGAADLLPMYCAAVLAVPLGLAGRREEIRQVVAEEENPLTGPAPLPPVRLQMQLGAALVGMTVLWWWLTWG